MLLAVGLVMLALAVGLFAVLTPTAPQSRPLLVATRTIRAGEVISGSDVKAVSVASSQVSGVPASRRDQFVGRTAGLDIGTGQPLVEADLGGGPGPGPGEAVLGLSLADGRFPSTLSVGDAVVVVDTPTATSSGSTPSAPGVELASGRILSVSRSGDGTHTDVSLIVPTSRSDGVAAASAADSVSLVWITQKTAP
jgi:hypothetical protein